MQLSKQCINWAATWHLQKLEYYFMTLSTLENHAQHSLSMRINVSFSEISSIKNSIYNIHYSYTYMNMNTIFDWGRPLIFLLSGMPPTARCHCWTNCIVCMCHVWKCKGREYCRLTPSSISRNAQNRRI